MDIKDGVYVPSYGIGPDYLDYLNKHIDNLKPMDAHLMVKHPQQYLETFAKAGATYITPHTDCIEGDAFVTINKIKELGCKAGVALSPSVPLEAIEFYLPLLDKVTIMIVDPGISGQKVDPQMFVKIKKLAKIRKERNLNFLIEADGSMNYMLHFIKQVLIWLFLDLLLFGTRMKISQRLGKLWKMKLKRNFRVSKGMQSE